MPNEIRTWSEDMGGVPRADGWAASWERDRAELEAYRAGTHLPEWLDKGEAAAYLNERLGLAPDSKHAKTPKAVARMRESGKLHGELRDGMYLYHRHELARWAAAAGGVGDAPAQAQGAVVPVQYLSLVSPHALRVHV